MEQFKAGRVKQAIIKITKPGTMRLKALALAKKDLNISRTTPNSSNRRVAAKDVSNLFGELKKEHISKSTVEGRAISGMTKKGFARTAYEATAPKTEAPSAVEQNAKYNENKQQINKNVGLQGSAVAGRKNVAENIHTPKIVKALDEVTLEELENTQTGGIKGQVPHQSAAKIMGLRSNLSVPHLEAAKTFETAPAGSGSAPASEVSSSAQAMAADGREEMSSIPESETGSVPSSAAPVQPPAESAPVADDPFGPA